MYAKLGRDIFRRVDLYYCSSWIRLVQLFNPPSKCKYISDAEEAASDVRQCYCSVIDGPDTHSDIPWHRGCCPWYTFSHIPSIISGIYRPINIIRSWTGKVSWWFWYILYSLLISNIRKYGPRHTIRSWPGKVSFWCQFVFYSFLVSNIRNRRAKI